MPEFDRDPKGRHREHAAPLYPGSPRSAGHLIQDFDVGLAQGSDGGGPAGPLILAIETAGSACSVAVSRAASILASETRAMRHGHSESLLPMVGRVMDAASQRPAGLDVVAVSTGPGGFTGIRVGLAAAHGIALATRARLVGITVFQALATVCDPAAASRCEVLLVAADSRRAEIYVQLFTSGAIPLAEPAALLPEDLAAYVTGRIGSAALLIAGDAGEAAARAMADQRRVELAPESTCDARAVVMTAARLLHGEEPLSPARPFYLRPPDVTLAKRPDRAGASPIR